MAWMNKLLTDLSNKEDDDEQETTTTKTEVFPFASRSKVKAKPLRRISACSSARTLPVCRRSWADVGPDPCSLIANPLAKTKHSYGELLREEDGAIEFWRLKDDLRNNFEYSKLVWWKAKGWGNKKRSQYCTDPSGQEIHLRALQGHSGRNPIDPTLQDNVLIPETFFEYIIILDVQSVYTPQIQDW